MKKLFMGILLLVQAPSLLPVVEATTKKIVHKKIKAQDCDQYIIGAEITNNDITIGIFKVEEQSSTLVIEYHDTNKHIKDIYQYVRDIVQDAQEHHDVIVQDACFAIPGIAKGDLFLHPHMPWSTSDDTRKHSDTAQRGVNKQKFVALSGLQNVYFINDFQAVALGTQLIDPATLTILQPGKNQPQKTKLVIGAGNGLGASLLLWDNELTRYIPSQLNYSFTEFGAQSNLELAFFNFMKDKTGNIAWGKVLGAGAGGIKLIYRFFEDYDAQKDPEHKKYHKAPFIEYEDYLDIFKNYATSARCKDAVDFFIDEYARIIRNAAYAQAALGGVYITNTVVQEFPEFFNDRSFINKIVNLQHIVLDEGSRRYLEGYLSDIPFYLITNKKVQLYGAAALCIEPNLIRN